MTYDTRRHNRRSIRLKSYDYCQVGSYFITICTQHQACLFGDVVNGQMRLNDAGQMIQMMWNAIPQHHPGIKTDAFTIMPNHIHGIIQITNVTHDSVGAGLVPAPINAPVPDHDVTTAQNGATTRVAPTIGQIIGAFKSKTTVAYIQGVRQFGWLPFNNRLWQRNYYEHIIRDEPTLNRICGYILNNPLRWQFDRENPHASGPDIWWQEIILRDRKESGNTEDPLP